MKMNILAAADALSPQDLLARLDVLAGREREASAELVAHLAALESRPELYAAKGFGSLFSYCTQALRLSEDATCNRIEAAKACRRFPVLLDLLASGSMTLTSVRIVGRHLTPENHQAVLEKAKGRTRREIDGLVAELAPRPDVPTFIRKLPTLTAPPAAPATLLPAPTGVTSEPERAVEPSRSVLRQPARPTVQATAPERYRLQLTMDEEMHARLRRLQANLRREIRDGDPTAIIGRALKLLEREVDKTKLGAAANPRPNRSIRPRTDKKDVYKPPFPSRHVPKEVRRAVFRRDGGQCAFVSPDGRRCSERTFLEFHHVEPYAKRGPATVANISLRCRRHNQYEAELVFGPHKASPLCEERGVDTMRCLIRTPPRGL
jgi:5-methylcytosine-specific restriction endonuclease McrA